VVVKASSTVVVVVGVFIMVNITLWHSRLETEDDDHNGDVIDASVCVSVSISPFPPAHITADTKSFIMTFAG
jgi:hypothetical protein